MIMPSSEGCPMEIERLDEDLSDRINFKRSRSPRSSVYRQESSDSHDIPSLEKEENSNQNRSQYNFGVDIVDIANEDASFILGVGGRTKRKLSRVCGAEMNIKAKNGKTILEIRGNLSARQRAATYVDFVIQQRVGPVKLDFDPKTRSDLTCVKIPSQCVGYITGRKGQGLRAIEEECGTLMFFMNLGSKSDEDYETLAIFSPHERKRQSAKLKVMSAVEQKVPGYYTSNGEKKISKAKGFDTDRIPIADEDYSYALGRLGATRKKLARASGALLEYIGNFAYISGTFDERERARQYLNWLCVQRTSYVTIDDYNRSDCSIIYVPSNCVAYVTGSKGSFLRETEKLSRTFIFFDGESRGLETERLLIFGVHSDDRRLAKSMITERIRDKLSGRSMKMRYNRRNSSRSISGYREMRNGYYERRHVPYMSSRRDHSRSRSAYKQHQSKKPYKYRDSRRYPYD